jgi:hypothetical protein
MEGPNESTNRWKRVRLRYVWRPDLKQLVETDNAVILVHGELVPEQEEPCYPVEHCASESDAHLHSWENLGAETGGSVAEVGENCTRLFKPTVLTLLLACRESLRNLLAECSSTFREMPRREARRRLLKAAGKIEQGLRLLPAMKTEILSQVLHNCGFSFVQLAKRRTGGILAEVALHINQNISKLLELRKHAVGGTWVTRRPWPWRRSPVVFLTDGGCMSGIADPVPGRNRGIGGQPEDRAVDCGMRARGCRRRRQRRF